MTEAVGLKPKRSRRAGLSGASLEALVAELRRRSSSVALAWVPLEREGRMNVSLDATTIMGGAHRDLAHLVAMLQTQLLVRLASGLTVQSGPEL